MPVHHLLSVHSYPLHPPHLPYFPTRRSSDLDSGRRRAGERLDRLRRRIRPFMLRRSKELVASDLPEKQEQVVREIGRASCRERVEMWVGAGAVEKKRKEGGRGKGGGSRGEREGGEG